MKNRTRHKGILKIIKRLSNSKFGNPQYIAEIDGYRFRTKANSSHAYSIPNYDNQRVTVILGTHYNCLTLDQINKG